MKNKKLTYTVEEAKKALEKYCAYQDRCHMEVEQKLTDMKMITEAKEYIFLHLMQNDFLNEERFAKSFSRGKFRIKKWGKKRITHELKRRHISEYNIKSGLKEIDEDEYRDTLQNLAEKKAAGLKNYPAYQIRKKTYQYLIQKGFESKIINEVLNEVIGNQ